MLGGEYGDFELEDFDGTVHAAGASLWVGQHNLEYFGEDEYMMFDNAYDEKTYKYIEGSSRPMRLQLDEEGVAQLLSEHRFVLMGGPHRGGTTLLWRLIAQHPLVSASAETSIPRTMDAWSPIVGDGEFRSRMETSEDFSTSKSA